MILVTGGSGLLGSELITQLLSEGREVRAIYHKTRLPEFQPGRLQQYQCDILDMMGLEEAMVGIEQLYHCAAIVSFNPSKKQEMYKVNIEGTINVVNAALNNGIKKMVHVSSVSAFGKKKEGVQVTEAMAWSEETNHSSYGYSKYLSELEVWRAVGEGLDAVIVNPVIILGEGNWDAGSSQLFKSIYNEFPWYSEGVNGFVDVRDVAKAMIRLMESDINGERFIISAENLSYRDIFNMIADAFGKKQPKKKVTRFISQVVWRLEAARSRLTGKSPLVTRESAVSALAKVYYDNQKLLSLLPGFNYRPIEETIRDTCKRMQQKLNNH